MATINIPLTPSTPAFRFFNDLEGNSYEFYFRWTNRTELWVIDISDNQGNVIESGVPLVLEFPILYQNRNPNKWPGTLIALASNSAIPNRFNLGTDIKLYYVEAG